MQTDDFARACSDAMHANDRVAHWLGMEITETVAGKATATMRVRHEMLNGHDVCHGGMLFTLADTAFAHACNNTNKVTLASGCTIDFLAPAYEGQLLTARAYERSRSGRTGVYDAEIDNEAGQLIATFRGRSYQLKGSVLPES